MIAENKNKIVFIEKKTVQGFPLSIMYWEELNLFTGVLTISESNIISQSHVNIDILKRDIENEVINLLDNNSLKSFLN